MSLEERVELMEYVERFVESALEVTEETVRKKSGGDRFRRRRPTAARTRFLRPDRIVGHQPTVPDSRRNPA